MKIRELYNELVNLAGSKVALELFKKFDKQCVTIYKDDCDFLKVFTDLAGKKVVDEFRKRNGKIQVYIGLSKFINEVRNEEIRKRVERGQSIGDVGREFNLSAQRIILIVKGR